MKPDSIPAIQEDKVSRAIFKKGKSQSNKRNVSLKYIIAIITLLSSVFPYIITSGLDTDIQPHFILLFFLAYIPSLVGTFRNIPGLPVAVALGFFYGLLALFLNAFSESIALFYIPIFTIILANEDEKVMSTAIKLAIILYIIGCILQKIDGGGVLFDIVSNFRSSEQRGFNSFTSEPSYLSILSLVFLTYCLYTGQRYYWIVACIALGFLSGSVTGIVPMAILLFLYSVRGLNFGKILISFVFGVIIVGTLIIIVDPNSRLAILTTNVYNDPYFLLQDVSSANRLIRSIGPIYLAFEDWFIPHTYPEEFDLFVNWNFMSASSDMYVSRLSNISSILFYLFGFLSIPLIFIACKFARAPFYIIFISIYFVFTNITVATPYICIVFSLLYRYLSSGGSARATQHTHLASLAHKQRYSARFLAERRFL